jgi:hypothetical protein
VSGLLAKELAETIVNSPIPKEFRSIPAPLISLISAESMFSKARQLKASPPSLMPRKSQVQVQANPIFPLP